VTTTPSSRAELVLIGPSRAGKSTLAGLVAERLGVPRVSLDAIKWRYFAEMGFDAETGRRIRELEGFRALTLRLRPYALAMVERALVEHRDCVFDFGAGHSMFDEPEQIERLRRALSPFRSVVLTLPSPDLKESVRVLRERSGPWVSDGTPYFDFSRYEVEHPLNRLLATWIVYTEGRTPEACRNEILELMCRTT
jgi:shikimate kinase